MNRRWIALVGAAAVVASTLAVGVVSPAVAAPCDPGGSAIVCENSKPGTDPSIWDISGAGDTTIQGFATDISVDHGNRIGFKVDTDASAYTLQIYRLGWYGGDGARLITTLNPSATLPQVQPTCAKDTSTSLVDCGNWALSAYWDVPSTAVSGVYIARLIRGDTGGDSHIPFIVRDDSSHSDVVYQTSDTTWQAYNTYGGANFYYGGSEAYFGAINGRALKLSYNRPITTRKDASGRDFLFSNEFPMIRFLERNGYDVSYISGIDTDRLGSLLTNHHTYLSVGHDEYWSGTQRANVEAARDAGVNLAFFSGNEVYWKTRYEPSIDGSATAYRTIVCYKETWANAKIDPSPEWTGTWRDPRFSPPANGGNPENALTGTAYMSNDTDLAVKVSQSEGKLRLWRNTAAAQLAAGQTATLAPHTVGYESDEDLDNGFRPQGLIRLSTTTGSVPSYLQDYGNTTAPGTTTHHLTEYRAASGALVFSAGTIQWAWGLDSTHDGTQSAANATMQQATINVLGDMGAQPASLMSGMVPGLPSSDTTAPTTTITSPTAATQIANGAQVTVTGTASDVGGVVGGVEVSTDGGSTWHPATGTTSWTYTYTQSGVGTGSIRARAIDDSLNFGVTASVQVAVSCPCSIFGNTTPGTVDSTDPSAVELGVKWTASMDGWVSGVRFYKSAANTGSHIGTLWSATGQVLATGTFTGETSSGWQQLMLPSQVRVTAGTTYVVSYYAPVGRYSVDQQYFTGSAKSSPPLTALRASATVANGVYGTGHVFPTSTYKDSNYWVDVIFEDRDKIPPSVLSSSPLAGSSSVSTAVKPTAVFSEDIDTSSLTMSVTGAGGQQVSGSTAYDAASRTATFTPDSALANGGTYTVSAFAADTAGNAMASPTQWSFRTADADPVADVCPCRIWSDSTTPDVVTVNESTLIELGVRFSSDADGVVTGVRFYKGPQNLGVHTGSLWTTAGALLATATFSGESSSGWQTVTFSSPVSITKGTTYIASYQTTTGYYSATWNAFASSGQDSPPLHVAANAGVYKYGGGFPSSTYTANYWVDPIFTVPASMPPTIASATVANGATNVSVTQGISVTFTDPVQPGSATVTVTGPGGSVAGATTYDRTTRTVTFTPTSALAAATSYTATVDGARNLGGTPLSAPTSWTFTTAGIDACPCTLFASSSAPRIADSGDTDRLSLGVRFTAAQDGYVSGISFYKAPTNTGAHTVSLWSATGTRLGTANVTNESASGWQTASFSQPVSVVAGTTYVASYYAPSGHYSVDAGAFASTVTNGPLTAASPSNGVFGYGVDVYPASSFNSTNYWVTPVYFPGTAPDLTPPSVLSRTPADSALRVPVSAQPSATFSEDIAAGAAMTVTGPGGAVTGTTAYTAATKTLTFSPAAALDPLTVYTVSVRATDLSGNQMPAADSWTFTTTGTSTCPCTVFFPSETPANDNALDQGGPITVGVAVTPAVSGQITGLRFYKGSSNTGTHVGTLWSSTGSLLATGTFTGESASGWQTLVLSTPVDVTAGTTYVASYTSPTAYVAFTSGQLAGGLSSPPLGVPANGGRYTYTAGAFPGNTSGNNFWVDVVFATGGTPPADTTPPVISAVQAAAAPSGSSATVTWTTDESATSVVQYGTTTALGSTATGANGTSHSVALTGLSSATTYYYRVVSADAAGNSTTSPATTGSPATVATPDVTAPVVTAVAAGVSGTTATVTWTTDESATTSVSYGTTTALGTTATGTTGTAHSVALTGLAAGTYYYRVTSADAAGNSTTDPVTTSAPRTFVIADTTPPVITAVASTGSGTAATVTWTTNETSTSSVAYGTTTALGTTKTGTSGTSHSVSLTGLTPNTRYYFRVTSADAAGNSTTSPATTSAPASYLPTVTPIAQTTVADFNTGSGAYVSDTNGGEVLSTLTLGAEFAGTTIPTGFTSAALVTGGATTYSGGQAVLSGSRLYTGTYASGRSFASAATLGANHSIGWGSIASGSTAVTASFQTDASGALSARVNDGGANNQTLAVAGTWTGTEHEYRIDWANNAVVFFVDGTQVATSAFSTGLSLRVMASDPTTAAPVLAIDWLRVAPYGASTTFTSAVIDAGATVGWDTLTRDVLLPTGTTMTIQVRSGPNANTGSGAWTGWSTVSTTTNSITRSSRYLQYRLQFTTSGSRFTTPTVNSVQLAFHVL